MMGTTGIKGSTGSPGRTGQKGDTGPPGSSAPVVGGVIYNRWGKSSCRPEADLIYAGKTGVTLGYHQGGAANYLCMPDDPEYMAYRSGVQHHSRVYGAEYEGPPLVSGREQHNAPCAVCYVSTQHTVIMIPAKTSCPDNGWTREYYGYLMSERTANHRSMYECVDKDMESISESQNGIDGGHFYHVEAHCNGVDCPPYDSEKELTCVVCTK